MVRGNRCCDVFVLGYVMFLLRSPSAFADGREREMTISTTLSIYLVLDKENNYSASRLYLKPWSFTFDCSLSTWDLTWHRFGDF